MTEGLPCACASFTAWAMTFCTSLSERNELAFAQKPLQPESGVDCGGGGDVPALLPELLPPLQPVRAATTARTSQSSLVFRIAPSPQARIRTAKHRVGDASPATGDPCRIRAHFQPGPAACRRGGPHMPCKATS